jgi:hypothetical protein
MTAHLAQTRKPEQKAGIMERRQAQKKNLLLRPRVGGFIPRYSVGPSLRRKGRKYGSVTWYPKALPV